MKKEHVDFLVKSQEIKTHDVLSTLQKVCLKTEIPMNQIDFDIRKTFTYIKETGQGNFEPLNEGHAKRLEDPNYLTNEEMQIQQEYMIKLMPVRSSKNFVPRVSVSTDKLKSMAKVVFKKGSLIAITPDVKKNLYKFLNKLKLKNNMLISLLDKDMKAGLNDIIKRVNSDGILIEDCSIWLTKWQKPTVTIDDKIIFNYKEKNKKEITENEKIDYAERHFIIGVDEAEVLIEYFKPKQGRSGRGYNGKFIPMKEPNIDNIPTFKIDEATIEMVDTQEQTIYKAKQRGFVSMEGGVLKISQELKLKNINLRETGHVNPGVNTDVKIIVETGNAAEDAVGPDMIIEAKEIFIDGSVGAGAIIKGQKVFIKGQTHSTTTVYAQDLEVGVLKGTAFADTAKIKSFENARIYACDISIEQLFVGHVYGKTVRAKNVRAACEIRASYAIMIESLSCGDNRFFIDQCALLSSKKTIETCKETIKSSNKLLKEGTKEIVELSKYIRNNKANFEQIKEYMQEMKDKNTQPKPAYVKIFKEYLSKVKALESLQKEIEQGELAIESAQKALKEFDEKLKNTFIYNEGLRWQDTNNVGFIFHSKAYVADRVIENLPAVEIVGLKDKEDGPIAAIGMKDDFLHIDVNAPSDPNTSCDPLSEAGIELIEQEQKEEASDQKEQNAQDNEKNPQENTPQKPSKDKQDNNPK